MKQRAMPSCPGYWFLQRALGAKWEVVEVWEYDGELRWNPAQPRNVSEPELVWGHRCVPPHELSYEAETAIVRLWRSRGRPWRDFQEALSALFELGERLSRKIPPYTGGVL